MIKEVEGDILLSSVWDQIKAVLYDRLNDLNIPVYVSTQYKKMTKSQ